LTARALWASNGSVVRQNKVVNIKVNRYLVFIIFLVK